MHQHVIAAAPACMRQVDVSVASKPLLHMVCEGGITVLYLIFPRSKLLPDGSVKLCAAITAVGRLAELQGLLGTSIKQLCGLQANGQHSQAVELEGER